MTGTYLLILALMLFIELVIRVHNRQNGGK